MKEIGRMKKVHELEMRTLKHSLAEMMNNYQQMEQFFCQKIDRLQRELNEAN